MKIASLIQATNFLNRIQGKGEGDSARHQRQDSQQQQQNQKERENERPKVVSEQEVNSAMAEFHSDPQTRASGLKAETEGTGPGLRVVLKDPQGSVVRQLSGEEFLRMRQSVSKDPRARGKILDQKL